MRMGELHAETPRYEPEPTADDYGPDGRTPEGPWADPVALADEPTAGDPFWHDERGMFCANPYDAERRRKLAAERDAAYAGRRMRYEARFGREHMREHAA